MLDLEIRYGGGPPEVRPISKVHPISIGRHVSNDICIDEPGVAPIHCRVLWNNSKTHFEITSANRDGVELNGTLVRVAGLKEGDILRVGSADLIVRERDLERPKANIQWDVDAPILPVERPEQAIHTLAAMPVVHAAQSAEIPLKPAPEDTPEALQGWDRNVRRRLLPADLATRQPVAAGAVPPTPAAHAQAPVRPQPAPNALDDEDDESEVPIVIQRHPGKPEESFATRLSQRLSDRQVRPGEQQALRSPFILGMLGLTLALALAAGAIFLVIGRETSQQEFAAAKTEFDAKRYGQASELFEKYETDHPKDPHASEAHYQAWNARVLKEIGGGSPAWKRGREAVDKYVEANRERTDFNGHFPELADFLTRIALGAAHSAEASIDTDQLELASQAESMAARFFPDGKVPAEASTQFQEAFGQAQNAIEEHRQFTGRIAEIEKAIAARQPMAALAGRRELLARYPTRAGDGKLAVLLEKTLNVEKSLVVRKDLGRAALRKESAASPLPHVSLVLNTRSHSEEAVGARSVLVLAKDSCYAVDHLTGEPVWRRVIGLDSPFLPMSVDTAEPGLLLFDTNRLSLELISRQSGKLIWEQPINEPISGAPLVSQGQIYLATLGNHLDKLDLETGRLVSQLTFSQKIVSPPAIVRNNERLIVAGDASLVYTLSVSPLECIRVNEVGHQPGTLVNGVLPIGSRVLLTESGRPTATKLSVLDARSDDTWLKLIKTDAVEGEVRDPPVMYGKMLFVASTPARISAFSVSDAPGQDPLVPVSSMTIPKQEDSPIFLSPGPDGQLWMAGSSLRRLQLKLNAQSFALDPVETAIGISSQPLQVVGQYVFAARRLPYASSVFFSQIDREPMVGQWRTILGSAVIGHLAGSGGDVVTVGEAGEVFSVSSTTIDKGGFKRTAAAAIDPPPGTKAPLRATRLDDNRLAVDCGGPKPTLWFVTPGGQLESSFALGVPLEAGPVRLSAGLVLPIPGRLRLVSPSSGLPEAEDYLAPVENKKAARWYAVARSGSSELLTADSRGRLAQLQFRTEPVRHLAELRFKNLERPLDVPFAVAGTRVAYASADGVFNVLDAETLDAVYSEKLPAPALSPLWPVGSTVVFETQNHELLCYELSGAPKLRFHVPLGKTGPCGAPASVGGRLIIANRNGTLRALNPSTGGIVAQTAVGQPLSGGVIAAGEHLVVAAIDGTLYRVDSFLEANNKHP
jgi:outer membrane protein assembly factor BamB/pSer/pThr/pTyr-binding forkhead associated (FHA) protein